MALSESLRPDPSRTTVKDKGYYRSRYGPYWEDQVISKIKEKGIVKKGEEIKLNIPGLSHEKSEAGYIFDKRHGNNRYLVAEQDAESHTSTHFHFPLIIDNKIEWTVEDYEMISGKLFVNGVEVPPEGLRIPPLLPYQATTREEPSLSFIEMGGAYLFDEEQQHVHVSRALMWQITLELFNLSQQGKKK